MEQLITPREYTAWQLIKLYWQSEERSYAYLFAAIVIMMTMALVGLDVAISYWSNYFYDALQAYNKSASIYLIFVFCALAAAYILFAVYRYYLSQLLGLRWRKWMTIQFINRWLMHRDYYYLESFDEKTDNPDQRIQEDIGALVINTISLVIGFIGSIATFIAFIYVLWELSGKITLSLGSWGIVHIKGYLVWVSLIYAIVGTYITFKIGFPLVNLNFEQQRREANFRFAAIDLRAHAEDVALYAGENHQKNILQRIFSGVLDNWYAIILRQKLLLWFTAGYNQVSVLLPLLVALPNYFGKVFMLGGLMQSLRAFAQIQEASSFFVNAYTQIAEWRAIMRRLLTFLNHMHEIDEKVLQHNQLSFAQQTANKISVKNLSITTPRQDPLLNNINEEFVHGQHYLIKGVSGIGKSTFIRTIAGIWPYAQGKITLPQTKKIMYLPQQPYMPIGSLTEAILFPDKEYIISKKQLENILQDCRLSALIPRLDEVASWSEQLSPGEQQRISFARILLQKPDWVFLDESTSMLDLKNEEHLYQMLKEKLPNCSIVSVGHRVSLDHLHQHILDVGQYASA